MTAFMLAALLVALPAPAEGPRIQPVGDETSVSSQAVPVATLARGRVRAALVAGAAPMFTDSFSQRSTPGFGGGAVDACVTSTCTLSLSAFGAAVTTAGGSDLWAGAGVRYRLSPRLRFVLAVYVARPATSPLGAAALRLTSGRWTAEAGLSLASGPGGTGPQPFVSAGYRF